MAVYTNNSAGAASGTSVTAANSDDNSAGDAFSVVSGTRIYDNTWSHSGTTSFKCSGAAAAGLIGWNVGTSAYASFKGWFWFSALPAATQGILQCRIGSPDSNGGEVQVQADGKIRTSLDGWVSNTVLSTSTAYRLETFWVAGASSITGSMTVAIFKGDDLIPLEVHTAHAVNTGTTTFSGYRFGKITSSGTWDVWFDDVTYNDGVAAYISSGVTLKEVSIRDYRAFVVASASTAETVTLPVYQSGDTLLLLVARDTTSGSAFTGDSDVTVTEVATGNRKLSALLLTPINTSITSFTLNNSTSAKWRWWVASIVGVDPGYAVEVTHSDIGSNTTNSMAIPTLTTAHGNTTENGLSIAAASVATTATWNPIASTSYYSTAGDTALSVGAKQPASGAGTITWSSFDRGNNGSSRDESVLSLYLRPFDAEALVAGVSAASSSGVIEVQAEAELTISSLVRLAGPYPYDGPILYDSPFIYDPAPDEYLAYVISYGSAQADVVSSASASAYVIAYASTTSDGVSSVSASALTVDYGSAQADVVSSVSASALTVDYGSAQADVVSSVSASAYVIAYASTTADGVSSVSASAESLTVASATAASSTLVRVSDGLYWDGDYFYDDDLEYNPTSSPEPYVLSYADATVVVTSSGSVSAVATLYAAATSDVTSDLIVATDSSQYGSATCAVVSDVSASAHVSVDGSAQADVVSALTASAITVDYGSAQADVVSSVSASAITVDYGSAQADVVSALSASALTIDYGSAQADAVSTVSASAITGDYGSAQADVVSSVSASAYVSTATSADVSITSSLSVAASVLLVASTTSAVTSAVSLSGATQQAYGIADSNVVSTVNSSAFVRMYADAMVSSFATVTISGYTFDFGDLTVDLTTGVAVSAVLRSYGEATSSFVSSLSLSGYAVLYSNATVSAVTDVVVSADVIAVGSALVTITSDVEAVAAEALLIQAAVSPISVTSSVSAEGGILYELSLSVISVSSVITIRAYLGAPTLRNLSAENLSVFFDAHVLNEKVSYEGILSYGGDVSLLVPEQEFGDLTEILSVEMSD